MRLSIADMFVLQFWRRDEGYSTSSQNVGSADRPQGQAVTERDVNVEDAAHFVRAVLLLRFFSSFYVGGGVFRC